MLAARLYGPRDIRLEDMPLPAAPGAGEVLLRVGAVGICGSDLHMYKTGNTGNTGHKDMPGQQRPLILGHEFMGEIIALGEGALDGLHQPLKLGQRVAVDPANHCGVCELCLTGHPNLCPHHTFHGLGTLDGALQEQLVVRAHNCFPIPDSISDGGGTLLEVRGVALHTVDLGKLRVAHSVTVHGCGPVGLLVLRLAKLAGADPIFAFDRFPWRVQKALEWGATAAWTLDHGDPGALVMEQTHGRGVDVAFEVAWADASVQQAADTLRAGGRLVVAGIPEEEDTVVLKASVARRKGLTIMMVRRMKHTYPRAIQLATAGPDVLDLESLVSHHFALDEVPHAFALNAAYEDNVHKIIIDAQRRAR